MHRSANENIEFQTHYILYKKYCNELANENCHWIALYYTQLKTKFNYLEYIYSARGT